MTEQHQNYQSIHNTHISEVQPLIPPERIKKHTPITPELIDQISFNRQTIIDILEGRDSRLLCVIGPCSIHDPKSALEYAERLARLHVKYLDKLFIVMRVYFEKPRTTIGWKGLINDPDLDNTCDVNEGLTISRELLYNIANLGLPIGTEMLDPITPQYTADLVSWSAIGARTTESQTHREMVSGLSMPVGFKNATNGNVQVVADAIKAAENPHTFLGMNQDGQVSIIRTKGNRPCHLVLRGGHDGPNYTEDHIQSAKDILSKAGIHPAIMVDCSHANSNKDHRKQGLVWNDVIRQRLAGNANLIGMMLESNLYEGKQAIPEDLSQLKEGVSITDACISWEETEQLLDNTYTQI